MTTPAHIIILPVPVESPAAVSTSWARQVKPRFKPKRQQEASRPAQQIPKPRIDRAQFEALREAGRRLTGGVKARGDAR
jgi:hypothetical protein